jgi:hypothetical protein
MKYLLYYNYGGCNDGGHAADLEEFDTLEACTARAVEIRNRQLDGNIIIIHGEIMQKESW